jgi:hypothetical protein
MLLLAVRGSVVVTLVSLRRFLRAGPLHDGLTSGIKVTLFRATQFLRSRLLHDRFARRIIGQGHERPHCGEAGKIVREVKVASEPNALLQVLRNPVYQFKRIGLEAGPLSQWLFSALLLLLMLEARNYGDLVSLSA